MIVLMKACWLGLLNPAWVRC